MTEIELVKEFLEEEEEDNGGTIYFLWDVYTASTTSINSKPKNYIYTDFCAKETERINMIVSKRRSKNGN